MNRISLLTFGCEVGGGVVGNGVRLGKTGGAVGGGCIYCCRNEYNIRVRRCYKWFIKQYTICKFNKTLNNQ